MSTAVVPKASYNEGPIAPNVCVCLAVRSLQTLSENEALGGGKV